MYGSAQNGYGQIRRETTSPKSIESKLLIQTAAAIEAADPTTPLGYRQLADAITKNIKLWATLAADLMSEKNELPLPLRRQLVQLAQFSIQHGNKVLKGEEDREVLAEINRSIANGLNAVAKQAA